MADHRIATRDNWKIHPFKEGLTVKFPLSTMLDDKQFAEVKKGVIPQEMEDKWFVFYEKGVGNTGELYFHRSWTGILVYKVTLREESDGGATLTEVEINKDPEQYSPELEPRNENINQEDRERAVLGHVSFGVETGGNRASYSIPELGTVMDMINWVSGPGEKLSFLGRINQYLRSQDDQSSSGANGQN